jgi:hypothetical protein
MHAYPATEVLHVVTRGNKTMKCPKCGYVSYDYLDACRKCSVDLVAFKTAIHLEVIRPGDLDLSVILASQAEKMGHASAYSLDHIDDDFFSAQTMLVDRPEPPDEEAEEFDISLDDDLPETTSRASAFTGSAAADSGDFVSFEDEGEDVPLRSWSAESPTPPAPPAAPVNLIDMSDLEDLDDLRLDVEETSSQTETIELDEDTLMMPSAPVSAIDRPSESASADITFNLSEPEQEATPLSVDPIETVSEHTADDIPEAGLELQLKGKEGHTSAEPEADVLINLEEFDLNDDEDDDRPTQP